jgi:hypothetical protein
VSGVIVPLPTAAPRRVKQRWNKTTRAALAELPRFPEDRTYLARYPWMRDALSKARIIKSMDTGGTALMIATAMFKVLGERDQLVVQAICGTAAAQGAKAGLYAVDWLDYAVMAKFAEKHDIKRALEMLGDEEGEL